MTKKDFFRILIKLFGLYSVVITLFKLIPTYFSYALYNFDIPTILLALGASLISVAFFIALLFFSDKIIYILKLDKGFDDNYIKIGNITDVHIVKSAILILGGLLIIDNFPTFINYCFIYFKNHISLKGSSDISLFQPIKYFDFLISALSLLIGYLMLSNYSRISKWLIGGSKN